VDEALKYIISMGVISPGRGRRTMVPPQREVAAEQQQAQVMNR
jgi:uncharacterized membrane protein